MIERVGIGGPRAPLQIVSSKLQGSLESAETFGEIGLPATGRPLLGSLYLPLWVVYEVPFLRVLPRHIVIEFPPRPLITGQRF